MASFTDLIASHIKEHQSEFLAGIVPDPQTPLEELLASSLRRLWRPLPASAPSGAPALPVVAVDGSRAIRALNTGADWIIAQALLIGSGQAPDRLAETVTVRGDIEQPAVERYGALLMRKLELDLALQFVTKLNAVPEPDHLPDQSRAVLLLDGSLYAELPHLLYRLAVPGHEDLPLLVLERFLQLFDACRRSNVLLIGVAKSARSTVLARAILHDQQDQQDQKTLAQHDRRQNLTVAPIADAVEGDATADVVSYAHPSPHDAETDGALITDSEMLHRWTTGAGITDPVLLGTASFGHRRATVEHDPESLAEMFGGGSLALGERRSILSRLRAAPAIGVCYLRLAPGEDALRVDAPASQLGYPDKHLLDFQVEMLPAADAQPFAQTLLAGYGGASVYNAPLYVVDREVRLHARTVDTVYLSVLRAALQTPVQYDRSTRRFLR